MFSPLVFHILKINMKFGHHVLSSSLMAAVMVATISVSGNVVHATDDPMAADHDHPISACELIENKEARELCVAYENKDCDTEGTSPCEKIAENYLEITGAKLPQLRCPCWEYVSLPAQSLDNYEDYVFVNDYHGEGSAFFHFHGQEDHFSHSVSTDDGTDNHMGCTLYDGSTHSFIGFSTESSVYTTANFQICIDQLKDAITDNCDVIEPQKRFDSLATGCFNFSATEL